MYEKMLCFFKAHEYILTSRHWETSGKYSPAGRHTVLLHEFEQILSANFAHFQIVLDPVILIFLSESLINCSVKQYLIEQVRPAIQKLLA